MDRKLQYTIDGQYYTESGYTREELRGLAAHLQSLYPEVEIDIQWRAPVVHEWIDLTGYGIDPELQNTIMQLRDRYLMELTTWKEQ